MSQDNQPDREVLRGQRGVLFLGASIHRIAAHLTDEVDVAPSSIDAFAKNLQSRAGYCRDRGIGFRHVIFPDKASALSELFPLPVRRTFTDRYRAVLTPQVLDLQAVLAGRPELFIPTDTHLGFEGMLESSLAVLSTIEGLDLTDTRRELEALRGTALTYPGDLGSKLDPVETSLYHPVKWGGLRRFDNQVGANDGLCITVFNPARLRTGDDRRLLVFGDSFMERSLAMIGQYFSEVLFCRSRYFHPEMVEMFQPHEVITESAERYFSMVRLDEVAPRFLLMYGTRGSPYSEDRNFYLALNAQLVRHGDQHATFVRRLLDGAFDE